LSYIVHVDCCGLSTIVIKKIIIIIIYYFKLLYLSENCMQSHGVIKPWQLYPGNIETILSCDRQTDVQADLYSHRRRSSVNFRGARQFWPENMCENYQNTRIFMIFARKINQISEFYMIFARKMPEFYIIIARKIFSPNFKGGGARAPCPLSPTPMGIVEPKVTEEDDQSRLGILL